MSILRHRQLCNFNQIVVQVWRIGIESRSWRPNKLTPEDRQYKKPPMRIYFDRPIRDYELLTWYWWVTSLYATKDQPHVPQSMCQDAGNMGEDLYWFLVLLVRKIRMKHEKEMSCFHLVWDDDDWFEDYVTGVGYSLTRYQVKGISKARGCERWEMLYRLIFLTASGGQHRAVK